MILNHYTWVTAPYDAITNPEGTAVRCEVSGRSSTQPQGCLADTSMFFQKIGNQVNSTARLRNESVLDTLAGIIACSSS